MVVVLMLIIGFCLLELVVRVVGVVREVAKANGKECEQNEHWETKQEDVSLSAFPKPTSRCLDCYY